MFKFMLAPFRRPSTENKGNQTENSEHKDPSSHADSLLSYIKTLFDQNNFCDVVLIAEKDNMRIPAHRIILSASSAYFAAMLTGSMRESQQKEIVIKAIAGNSLRMLIKFCYTGCIDVSEQDVSTVLVVASFLQLTGAVDACSKFMIKHLHPSNCLSVRTFAEHHNIIELADKANHYAFENFTQVCKSDEFFELTSAELTNFLSSEDLNVDQEEVALNALIAWYNHDKTFREDCMTDLLSLIRLTEVYPDSISKVVKTLSKSNDFQAILEDAHEWHLIPARQKEVGRFKSMQPRKSSTQFISIIQKNDVLEFRRFHCYLKTLTMFRVTFLKSIKFRGPKLWISNRFQFSEKRIIWVGQSTDGYPAQEPVYEMNLQTMKIEKLPPMSSFRRSSNCVILNELVYIIGGWGKGKKNLNTVKRYDPTTRTWSNLSPMFVGRWCMNVAILNDLIFTVGGIIDEDHTNIVECFNPALNEWNLCAPTKSRSVFGIEVLNGFLYAISDFSGEMMSNVERYDPISDKWTAVASLNSPNYICYVTPLTSTLVVLKYLKDEQRYIAEEYCAEEDIWRQIGSTDNNEPLNNGMQIFLSKITPSKHKYFYLNQVQ